MKEYDDKWAVQAAESGFVIAKEAHRTRERLRRRTRPGAEERQRELQRQLDRVREAKRRLRPYNLREMWHPVPPECQKAANALRLEYKQLWKMLKRGEGRGAG